MIQQLESVVLFVNDIDGAAPRYAALLGVPVEHENPRYAFVRAPHGVIIGFHPADAKTSFEVAHLALHATRVEVTSAADALAAGDLCEQRRAPNWQALRGEGPRLAASFA